MSVLAVVSDRMRRAFLLAALAACGGDSTPPPTGAIAAAVTHYDYAFDIDSRAAHATIVATVTTAGDCWSLPMRAQDLANVKLDGVAATSATTDGKTLTACGEGYAKATALTLDADVSIPLATLKTSQVGYSITKDAQQNPFYYLVSWVGGCDRFGPCDNAPDKFATYHFAVTHPASFVVRCPGTITEPSATITECDFARDGGPTYSTFGVAAYPAWMQTDKGSWGGVHVTVYDRAQTGIAAAIDPTYHAGFVQWMQTTFGSYPYGTDLRVLTAPTYWSGFEHPGNIVLDDKLKTGGSSYANAVAHVLDHEMAHMWAGDQTTIASTYDFVWKEAMAEYLSYVWEDMNDPRIALVTANAWKQFAQPAKYYPVPLDKPALFDYYGDVYGPGPMVLFHQLEVMSSRAQVIDAIKSVLGSPHALDVDSLIAALTQHTGIDLAAYTTAWIKGTGAPVWPRYQVTFTPATGTSRLALHQLNPGLHPRGCKFHVALHGANVDQVVSIAVDTFHDGVDQTLDVTTPAFTVTSIDFDPLHECLVFLDSSMPRVRENPWVTERGRSLDSM